MSHVDLESGEEGSVCSCNSQFYNSTSDGFQCGSEILEDESSRKDSSDSDCSVDLESGEKIVSVEIEKDCRICHLSLVSSSTSNNAIELGCCCKDDLAAAHKQCAETWFKIKGNKTCEICTAVARNVVGPNDIEALQQLSESNAIATSSSAAVTSALERRNCLDGHRFLNVLLACMVFAFVISWLFHFNIPS